MDIFGFGVRGHTQRARATGRSLDVEVDAASGNVIGLVEYK